MSKALLSLSGPLATAPDALAASLYHFESIGLRGAEALNAVKIAAEGAKVGYADLEQTTNALTYAEQSGIKGVNGLSQAMGVFNTIVGSGDMTMTQLVEAIGSHGLLANAKASGVSIQEVGAALAVFGDNGIKGADASTALIQVMNDFLKPAAGGATALAKVGLSASRLRDDLSKGGLNTALQDLNTHFKTAGVTGTALKGALTDIFTKKASANIAVLLGNMDLWDTKLAINTRGAQTFSQQWEATTKTASFAIEKVEDSFKAAGITLATKLLPVVTATAVWLGTTLPHDIGLFGSALSGVGHTIGTVFGVAWLVAVDTLKLAGDSLGVIATVLNDLRGPLTIVGTLAITTWGAFKGAQIVASLIDAVSVRIKALPGQMAAMAASAKASASNYVGSMAALGTSSETAATTATVSMGAIADESAVMSGAVVTDGEAAAVGWAGLLGPLAGVAIGVGLLVSLFHHSSSASKEATDAATAYTDALKTGSSTDLTNSIVTQLTNNNVPETIDKLNKALGSTQYTGAQFAAAIQNSGTALSGLRSRLQAVIAAGTTYASGDRAVPVIVAITPAAQAAKKALADLNTQYTALSKDSQKDLIDTKTFAGVSSSIDQVTQSLNTGSQAAIVSSQAAQQYAEMLGITVDSNGIAAVSAATLTKAVTTVSDAYNDATQSGSTYLAALSTFSQSTGDAASRAALIGATLVAANGDALNYASAMAGAYDANQQLITSFDQAATSAFPKAKDALQKYAGQLIDLKTGTINYAQAGALPLTQSLQAVQTAAEGAAEAQYQHELATKGGTKAADDAYTTYVSQTKGQLIDEANRLGLSKTQAQLFADQYDGIADAPDIKKTIEMAGADPVVTVLNQIGQQLSYLTGRPWTASISLNTNQVFTAIGQIEAAINKAIGGLPAGTSQAGSANLRKSLTKGLQLEGRGTNAGGTLNWRGGPTSLAEAGYELVTAPSVQSLPKGSHVYDHAKTEDWLNSLGKTAAAGVSPAAIADALDGVQINISAGSMGTFTGFIDARASRTVEGAFKDMTTRLR